MNYFRYVVVVIIGYVGLIAQTDAAGLTTPLQVASAQSVYDEFHQLLKGNAESPGDIVQILQITDGNIYPPQADGQPNTNNPIVLGGETAMGALTAPGVGDIGYFGCTIANSRPANGDQLFVRIFNASLLENATFYGDSEIFTVSGNNVFLANISSTDIPRDVGDDDEDGLNNSWERAYGTYEDMRADSDFDGMSDWDEHLAGSNPNDALSIFEVDINGDTDLIQIIWPSSYGKKYIVGYAAGDIATNDIFVKVSGTVTGVASQTSFEMDPEDDLRGTIRVRAIE